MQHISCEQVRQLLFSSIDHLLSHREEFLRNPQSDFTRARKISFVHAILFPMLLGHENLATELMDFFDEDKLPLPSAMVQRRSLIRPEAFQELLFHFTEQIPVLKTFHGYQLVSCDGSRLNLPYNTSDPDTFIQCIEGRKGINQMHMNALYDPVNDLFLDIELQSIHEMNEKAAFTVFLDKYAHLKTALKRIYIADRGYASYNIFAHAIHNGQLFLIRVPESFAKGICRDRENRLAGEYADEEVTVHIGRRRSKRFQELENFHYIPSDSHYDYARACSDDVDCLGIRILKFPISGDSFEYIVTNLPKYSFSLETVKKLYKLRWNQETAFRYLKYGGNIVHLHSLKKEYLLQEIFAKLTLYNFSACLEAAVKIREKKTDKYTYVINHTQMQKICIRFLRGAIQSAEELISGFLVPIRPGRSFERKLRRQSAEPLTYR